MEYSRRWRDETLLRHYKIRRDTAVGTHQFTLAGKLQQRQKDDFENFIHHLPSTIKREKKFGDVGKSRRRLGRLQADGRVLYHHGRVSTDSMGPVPPYLSGLVLRPENDEIGGVVSVSSINKSSKRGSRENRESRRHNTQRVVASTEYDEHEIMEEDEESVYSVETSGARNKAVVISMTDRSD